MSIGSGDRWERGSSGWSRRGFPRRLTIPQCLRPCRAREEEKFAGFGPKRGARRAASAGVPGETWTVLLMYWNE